MAAGTITRERRAGRRRHLGTSLVEFSLVAPVVFMVIFGIVEFSRFTHDQSTIADAARQGARQATANADSADNPFGSYSGQSCSGIVLTYNVTAPSGCLTDAAILHTVQTDMASVTPASDVIASCSGGAPPQGEAYVCVTPADGTTGTVGGTTTSCPGNGLPTPSSLGDRKTEWTAANGNKLKGCYLVEVAITYTYRPLTPMVGTLIGDAVIKSSTSIVAEY